ncbi:hypothetical protein M427DRAFT_144124 [Gonapodya prolifera JEL478]|uniref:Uncharacterized protein n=1 Tax=Gonapodya prolifera (strain JEL478) TaxID=1344416 RepID=A0A139ALQ1_GONPJ|nr:hypothetical protein M427DRAFT_144124 [Gonapodya prolifera JEL478]|eukprot:KXS17679.1 hypothetical protein M427DRAFT_144124 [Gonapodya prolifera JEL478]
MSSNDAIEPPRKRRKRSASESSEESRGDGYLWGQKRFARVLQSTARWGRSPDNWHRVAQHVGPETSVADVGHLIQLLERGKRDLVAAERLERALEVARGDTPSSYVLMGERESDSRVYAREVAEDDIAAEEAKAAKLADEDDRNLIAAEVSVKVPHIMEGHAAFLDTMGKGNGAKRRKTDQAPTVPLEEMLNLEALRALSSKVFLRTPLTVLPDSTCLNLYSHLVTFLSRLIHRCVTVAFASSQSYVNQSTVSTALASFPPDDRINTDHDTSPELARLLWTREGRIYMKEHYDMDLDQLSGSPDVPSREQVHQSEVDVERADGDLLDKLFYETPIRPWQPYPDPGYLIEREKQRKLERQVAVVGLSKERIVESDEESDAGGVGAGHPGGAADEESTSEGESSVIDSEDGRSSESAVDEIDLENTSGEDTVSEDAEDDPSQVWGEEVASSQSSGEETGGPSRTFDLGSGDEESTDNEELDDGKGLGDGEQSLDEDDDEMM